MRKSHLVIQPGVKSLTQIGALLLFLACPNIAFVGRDRQDIQPSCSFSTMSLKWLQKKPESEFLRHLDQGFLSTAYELGNENEFEQIINGDKHSIVLCGDNESISFQHETTVPFVNLLLSTSLHNDTTCGNEINSLSNEIPDREPTVFPSVNNKKMFRSIVNENPVKRNVNRLDGHQGMMMGSRLPTELSITRFDLHRSNYRRTYNANTRETRDATRRAERSELQDRLPRLLDRRYIYRDSRNEIRQNEVDRKTRSSNLPQRELQSAFLNSRIINSLRSFDPNTLKNSKTQNFITKPQFNRREQNIYPVRLMEAYRFDSQSKIGALQENSRLQPMLKRNSRESRTSIPTFHVDSSIRSDDNSQTSRKVYCEVKTKRDSRLETTVRQRSRNELTNRFRVSRIDMSSFRDDSFVTTDPTDSSQRLFINRRETLTRTSLDSKRSAYVQQKLDERRESIDNTRRNQQFRDSRMKQSTFRDDTALVTDSNEILRRQSIQRREKRSVLRREALTDSRRSLNDQYRRELIENTRGNQQFKDSRIERFSFRDDTFVPTDTYESSRRPSIEGREKQTLLRREALTRSRRSLDDQYRRESVENTRKNQPFRDSNIEISTFRDDTDSNESSRRNSIERRVNRRVSHREATTESGRSLNDQYRREARRESIENTRRNQPIRDSRVVSTFHDNTDSYESSRRNSMERQVNRRVSQREAVTDSGRSLNDQYGRDERRESIENSRGIQQLRDSRFERSPLRDDRSVRADSYKYSRRPSFERQEKRSISRREVATDSRDALNDQFRREERRESTENARRNRQFRDSRIERSSFRDDTDSNQSLRRNSIERQVNRRVSQREAVTDSGRSLNDQDRREERRESTENTRRNRLFRDSRIERSSFRDDTFVRTDSYESSRRPSIELREKQTLVRREALTDSRRSLNDQFRRESIENTRKNQPFRYSRIEISTFRDDTDSNESSRRNSIERRMNRRVSQREAVTDSGRSLNDQYRREERRESIENTRRNQPIRDSRIEISTFRDDTESSRRNSIERRINRRVSQREAVTDSGRSLNDQYRRDERRESIENSRGMHGLRDSRFERSILRDDRSVRADSYKYSRRPSFERLEKRSISRREVATDSRDALNDQFRREERRESTENARRNQPISDSRIEISTFRDDTDSNESSRRNSIERRMNRRVSQREAVTDSGRSLNDQYRRDERRESIENSRGMHGLRDSRFERSPLRDDRSVRADSYEYSRRPFVERLEKRSISRREAATDSRGALNDQYRREERRESTESTRRNRQFRDSRIERSSFRDDTFVRTDSYESSRRPSIEGREKQNLLHRDALTRSRRSLNDQYRRESVENTRKNQPFRDSRIEISTFRDDTDSNESSRRNSIERRVNRRVSHREATTDSGRTLNNQYRREERRESIENSRGIQRDSRFERSTFRDDTFVRTDSNESSRRISIERREKRSVSRRGAIIDYGLALNDQDRRDARRETLVRFQPKSRIFSRTRSERQVDSRHSDNLLQRHDTHDSIRNPRRDSRFRVVRIERSSFREDSFINTDPIESSRRLSVEHRETQVDSRRSNNILQKLDERRESIDNTRSPETERMRTVRKDDDLRISRDSKVSRLSFRNDRRAIMNRANARVDVRLGSRLATTYQQNRDVKREQFDDFRRIRLFSNNFRTVSRLLMDFRIQDDFATRYDGRLLNREVSKETKPTSRRVSLLNTRLNTLLSFGRDYSLSLNVRRNGNERRESIDSIRRTQTDNLLHNARHESKLSHVSTVARDDYDNRRFSQRVSGERLVYRNNRFFDDSLIRSVSTKRQELGAPAVTNWDVRLRSSSNNNFRRMQTWIDMDSRITVTFRQNRNARRDSRESIMKLDKHDLRYAAKLQTRFSRTSRDIRSSFRDSSVVRSEPSEPNHREIEVRLSRLSRNSIMAHQFGERRELESQILTHNNIRFNSRLTANLQRDVRTKLFDISRKIQKFNDDSQRDGRREFMQSRITRMSPDDSTVRSEARLISRRVSSERRELENQARTNRDINLDHRIFANSVSRLTARRDAGVLRDSRLSRSTSPIGSVIRSDDRLMALRVSNERQVNEDQATSRKTKSIEIRVPATQRENIANSKAFESKRIQTFTDSRLEANRDSKDSAVGSKSRISNLRTSDERREYENVATRRNTYRRDFRLDTIYQERRNNDLTLLPKQIYESKTAIDLALVIQILGTLLLVFLSTTNSKPSFVDKFGWMLPKSFHSNLLDSSQLTYALKC